MMRIKINFPVALAAALCLSGSGTAAARTLQQEPEPALGMWQFLDMELKTFGLFSAITHVLANATSFQYVTEGWDSVPTNQTVLLPNDTTVTAGFAALAAIGGGGGQPIGGQGSSFVQTLINVAETTQQLPGESFPGAVGPLRLASLVVLKSFAVSHVLTSPYDFAGNATINTTSFDKPITVATVSSNASSYLAAYGGPKLRQPGGVFHYEAAAADPQSTPQTAGLSTPRGAVRFYPNPDAALEGDSAVGSFSLAIYPNFPGIFVEIGPDQPYADEEALSIYDALQTISQQLTPDLQGQVTAGGK